MYVSYKILVIVIKLASVSIAALCSNQLESLHVNWLKTFRYNCAQVNS